MAKFNKTDLPSGIRTSIRQNITLSNFNMGFSQKPGCLRSLLQISKYKTYPSILV